jgi:glycosyltransferase involved in cell wall biosynthesis
VSPQVAPRVLLLIDHLDMGGAERILVETAPRVAVHGLQVRVGILDDRPAGPLARSLRERGVVVDRLGFRRLLDWAALRRLDRCIRSYRPAVVHAQLEFANIAGLWLGRRYGAKGVTTLHTMVEPSVRLDRASLRLGLERWSIGRRADRVICVSEALAENCRTTWMLPADRLEVLHNGIDLQRFKPPSADAAAAARASLGLAADADVLMTVAVLRPLKGLACISHGSRCIGALNRA